MTDPSTRLLPIVFVSHGGDFPPTGREHLGSRLPTRVALDDIAHAKPISRRHQLPLRRGDRETLGDFLAPRIIQRVPITLKVFRIIFAAPNIESEFQTWVIIQAQSADSFSVVPKPLPDDAVITTFHAKFLGIDLPRPSRVHLVHEQCA